MTASHTGHSPQRKDPRILDVASQVLLLDAAGRQAIRHVREFVCIKLLPAQSARRDIHLVYHHWQSRRNETELQLLWEKKTAMPYKNNGMYHVFICICSASPAVTEIISYTMYV
ncbi:hypothetical protein GOODEAATRI_018077 [Goodea atripinnis]|uniref:Uncharacterized protein n=1 Tax=Goodea atripinnis TaxID=208336 RepID=A0ABV0MKS2_9TELE